MAQYDVYTHPHQDLLLLDVQSGVLDTLGSRVVIPLVPMERANLAMHELNPVFSINGKDYLLSTQDMAGVSTKVLKRKVASAVEQRMAINAAVDFLLYGY
jgi:toxin CcdB